MTRFDQHFIQEMKKKLNLELLGVASVDASPSRELTNKVASLLPRAKSVLVLGKEVHQEVVALLSPSKEAGEAELGELLKPHGDFLNGQLTRASYELGNFFQKEGYRSLILPAAGCPMDQKSLTAIFSYKHAAYFAGLGSLGKHSLLITQEHGPRVRLACLLTEAPLEASPLVDKNYCVDCDACIRACPAQALQTPAKGDAYSISKFACQAYRQAGFTCSVCMKVCDEVLS